MCKKLQTVDISRLGLPEYLIKIIKIQSYLQLNSMQSKNQNGYTHNSDNILKIPEFASLFQEPKTNPGRMAPRCMARLLLTEKNIETNIYINYIGSHNKIWFCIVKVI